MSNNTVSKNYTHFLRGVEMIEEHHVPNENWCYPTDVNFGHPKDCYYGEFWSNGMDWNKNYWLLENVFPGKPLATYAMYFLNNEKIINRYDLNELLMGIMYYRRNKLWIYKNVIETLDNYRSFVEWFGDSTWPHLQIKAYEIDKYNMASVYYEHASQKRVDFKINVDCLPQCVLMRLTGSRKLIQTNKTVNE
jgi:hypothetical protein